MIRLFQVAVAMLAVICSRPLLSKPAAVQVSWRSAPETRYYIIVVETSDGSLYRLKSSSNSIFFLELVHRIGVWAYDHRDKVVDRPALAVRSIQPDSGQSEDENGLQEEDATPPPPTREQLRQRAAVAQLERDREAAFDGPPYRKLSAGYGFGKETMDASGGSSKFSGQASAGMFDIDLIVDLLAMDRDIPWRANIEAMLHAFKIEESSAGTSTQSSEEQALRRYQFRAAAEYVTLIRPMYSLGVQLGWGFEDIPTMTKGQTGSTNMDLESQNLSAVTLGLTFNLQLSPLSRLYLASDSFVTTFADSVSSFQSLQLKAVYSQKIIANISIDPSIAYRSAKSTYQIDCTNGSNSCLSSGSTELNTIAIAVAAGITF